MRSEAEIREYIEDLAASPLLDKEPNFDLVDDTQVARLMIAVLLFGMRWAAGEGNDQIREFAKKWARVDLDNGD